LLKILPPCLTREGQQATRTVKILTREGQPVTRIPKFSIREGQQVARERIFLTRAGPCFARICKCEKSCPNDLVPHGIIVGKASQGDPTVQVRQTNYHQQYSKLKKIH